MVLAVWKVVRTVLKAIGATVLWTFGVLIGLAWFLKGIRGYPHCPGVEPGESCSFTSARGTKRVPYEDLGKVDVFSLVLGSVTLLVLAGLLWLAVVTVVDAWKARRRAGKKGNAVKPSTASDERS